MTKTYAATGLLLLGNHLPAYSQVPSNLLWDFTLQQQKQIFLGLFIFAALKFITISIIFYYRQKLNKAKIQALEKEKEKAELESRAKAEVLASLFKGQELERERVSKDLHDSFGGLIGCLNLNLQKIQEQYGEIAYNPYFRQAKDTVQLFSQEIRTIAEKLQPHQLQSYGLIGAVQHLVWQSEFLHRLSIEFYVQNSFKIADQEQELALFRVIQELLHNVIKHAKASRVYLNLLVDKEEELLKLTVEDNGEGFDLNAKPKGRGIQNIQSRIEHLAGHLTIETAPHRGTIVFIEIPTKNLKLSRIAQPAEIQLQEIA